MTHEDLLDAALLDAGMEAAPQEPADDAGPSDASIGPSFDAGGAPTPPGSGIHEGCTIVGDDSPLQMPGSPFAVFNSRFVKECEALTPNVLLRNVSADLLFVERITTLTGDFELVDTALLPQSLGPSDSLGIHVKYTGNTHSTGWIRALTSFGCLDFEIRGSSPTGTLISQSAMAIDFGKIPLVEDPPSTRELRLLLQQPVGSSETISLLGVSTDPDNAFAAIASRSDFESCEETIVWITFTPPQVSGVVQGTLLWNVLTEREGSGAETFSSIDLYAEVVTP